MGISDFVNRTIFYIFNKKSVGEKVKYVFDKVEKKASEEIFNELPECKKKTLYSILDNHNRNNTPKNIFKILYPIVKVRENQILELIGVGTITRMIQNIVNEEWNAFHNKASRKALIDYESRDICLVALKFRLSTMVNTVIECRNREILPHYLINNSELDRCERGIKLIDKSLSEEFSFSDIDEILQLTECC